eukprot:1463869-Ditylum_brightwellii.AAC.1
MAQYIMKRTGLTMLQMEQIDWDNLRMALEHQKTHSQICLIKFMNDWLNTGEPKQKKYKEAIMSCQVCCTDKETWQHLFHCNHDDSVALCTLTLTKFKSALIKMKTVPIICQVLCYNVAQWCKLPCGTPPCLPTDATTVSLSAAVKTQGYLGWHNFIKGRMAKEWCQTQA